MDYFGMLYKKNIFYFSLIVALICTACQKKLDSLVGKDLLESNNSTFIKDTILEVYTLSDNLFPENDTMRVVPSSYLFPVGHYSDQYFGGIATTIYMQLKPPSYPFVLQTKNAILDSVVLGLKVSYIWGDTVIKNLVKYQVNEINDPNFTIAHVTQYFNLLSNANDISTDPTSLNANANTINIRSRFDSFYSYGEAVVGQYRIKLNNSIGQKILNAYNADTTALSTDNNWNNLLKGFKISPDITLGNSLSYLSLVDTTTRLSLYYHDSNFPDSPFIAKFYFRTDSSAYALNVNKTRTTLFDNHYQDYSNNNNNQLFLETQPGGYTLLQIPELQNDAFKNIIINQAILLAEVDPTYYNLNPTGNQNLPPSFIYLDVDSNQSNSYIPLPYDLNYVNNYTFFPSAGINYTYFQGNYIDSAGKFMGYQINLTRTTQNEIKRGASYTYRLYAPLLLNYGTQLVNFAYANSLVAGGRTILIGNYKGENKNPHRLRLHLIYTKIQ